MFLLILFEVPSLKKLSKHHHTCPCCAPKLASWQQWRGGGWGRASADVLECSQFVLLGLSLPLLGPMKGAEKPLRRGRLVLVNKHTDTDLQKSQYISICSAKAVTSWGEGGGKQSNRTAARC